MTRLKPCKVCEEKKRDFLLDRHGVCDCCRIEAARKKNSAYKPNKADILAKRNKLLDASAHTEQPSWLATHTKKEAKSWLDYRVSLRSIDGETGHNHIIWPVKPV